MKPISQRSPEEIWDELRKEFNYNILAMAENYSRTPEKMTELLRFGGDEYRRKQIAASGSESPVTASFDVGFAPMVNVTLEVANPDNLSEEDENRIIHLAVEQVRQNFNEKISHENVDFIKRYIE